MSSGSEEKPTRQEQRRRRTREAIIAAAAKLFLENGVSHTTVADITEAADLGYGSFYNHFHSLEALRSAVAEVMILRVAGLARTIIPAEDVHEMGLAVALRVFIRLLAREPAIRWLLEYPYVFVDEWHKTVTPFVIENLGRATPSPHAFKVMGGLDVWLAMYPWMIIPVLNEAIEQGASEAQEENFASIALHLLGLDDARRNQVLSASRAVMHAAALPAGWPLGPKC